MTDFFERLATRLVRPSAALLPRTPGWFEPDPVVSGDADPDGLPAPGLAATADSPGAFPATRQFPGRPAWSVRAWSDLPTSDPAEVVPPDYAAAGVPPVGAAPPDYAPPDYAPAGVAPAGAAPTEIAPENVAPTEIAAIPEMRPGRTLLPAATGAPELEGFTFEISAAEEAATAFATENPEATLGSGPDPGPVEMPPTTARPTVVSGLTATVGAGPVRPSDPLRRATTASMTDRVAADPQMALARRDILERQPAPGASIEAGPLEPSITGREPRSADIFLQDLPDARDPGEPQWNLIPPRPRMAPAVQVTIGRVEVRTPPAPPPAPPAPAAAAPDTAEVPDRLMSLDDYRRLRAGGR